MKIQEIIDLMNEELKKPDGALDLCSVLISMVSQKEELQRKVQSFQELQIKTRLLEEQLDYLKGEVGKKKWLDGCNTKGSV